MDEGGVLLAQFNLTANSKMEVLDTYDEDVIVTNREGIVIKASKSSGQHYGLEAVDLIGRSVYDLEQEKIFCPAITPLVLKQKKKIVLIQSTPKGTKVLITGIPFYSENGEIEYVISYSYAVDELLVIQEYMQDLEFEMAKAQEELSLLRKKALTIDNVVLESPSTREAFETAERIASLDASTVIYGHFGTGRTTVAKTIHSLSKRKEQAFIDIDCATIPEQLFMKELLGEQIGESITPGLLALAHKGTIFFKNIDRLTIHIQSKLITILKEKQYCPIGSSKYYPFDARLLCSATHDLGEHISDKRFLEELYYLIQIVPIRLRPLQQRTEDVRGLISHFLAQLAAKYHVTKQISAEAFQVLIKLPWTNNIPELHNVLERSFVQSTTTKIDLVDIPSDYAHQVATSIDLLSLEGETLPHILEQVEMHVIENAKNRYKTTTKMAKILGISQPSVVRKLKKYTAMEDEE